MPHEAVFLDRDGTLIEEVHYLSKPEQIRLIPGAAAAVRRINKMGALVIVVTNQAGVARGYFPERRVQEIHDHLDVMLAALGAKVNHYYYCPHHPTEGIGAYDLDCTCRKPKPRMLLTAAQELSIDLARSWMIGDKICDARAGEAAGCRSILVRTGHGKDLAAEKFEVARDLSEAVEIWATKHDPGFRHGF